MKEYFLSLIALAFVGGGVLMLAPEGGGKKSIKLLCSLSAVACILLPLSPLLTNGDIDADSIAERFEYNEESIQTYDEIYNSSLTSAELKNAEQLLKNQVASRFNVKHKAFDIRLNAEISSGEYYISSVLLIIYASGLAIDPGPICIYISEQLSCECEVHYSA